MCAIFLSLLSMTLTPRSQIAPFFRSIHTAVTQPSISVGLGLVYRFDPIRVEVNLGVPLIAAKGEVLKRGPQVGIGLEFL